MQRCIQITIQFDPLVTPISGWLQEEAEPRQPFQGMLELMSLLDAAREQAAEEADADGRQTD